MWFAGGGGSWELRPLRHKMATSQKQEASKGERAEAQWGQMNCLNSSFSSRLGNFRNIVSYQEKSRNVVSIFLFLHVAKNPDKCMLEI